MRCDYSITPSMIGAQAGLTWVYNEPSVVTTFDEAHPLAISGKKCNDSSFCLWYLSPVWTFADPNNTQYALLGEFNKWTAVSRQRFTSLTTNPERTTTIVGLVGGTIEIVEFLVYHSKLVIVRLNCSLSCAEGILQITLSTVTCFS
ncbi:unnamed protein product [Rotaria socialis]|uniref:Uncharacterized protein n=1 Tax=Rotaria socialis TaxID=392032 RepID=A0A820KLM9_9BILA|nr:unnamed protein product [Rotaria socialis]CAF4344685.1 unnamed protein product [Rotaria socialis]